MSRNLGARPAVLRHVKPLARLVWLGAALAPVLVGAQSPAHLAVDQALANLRGSSSLWTRLDAIETVGSTARQRTIHLFWSSGFDPQGRAIAKTEMRDFDQGVLATRFVGDGTTFWRHDLRANTYSAKRYGNYDGTVPPNYLQDLLRALAAASEGHGTWLARLVKETYGTGGSHFTGWMPGDLAPAVLDTGSKRDPVVPSRTYVATPELEYAMFHASLPGSERSLVFEIDKGSGRRLQTVYYAERDALGKQARLREWTARVWPNAIPAAVNFTFLVPPGATPVAHRGG